MISEKATSKPCSSCEHMTGNLWCRNYVNDVTGQEADIASARATCRGEKWAQRPTLTDHIVFTTTTSRQAQEPDKIETPMATIYKDPPAKLYE